jgi:hypothetical protein
MNNTLTKSTFDRYLLAFVLWTRSSTFICLSFKISIHNSLDVAPDFAVGLDFDVDLGYNN